MLGLTRTHKVFTTSYKNPTAYNNAVGFYRELARIRSDVRLKASISSDPERYIRLADMIGVVQSSLARQIHREPGDY